MDQPTGEAARSVRVRVAVWVWPNGTWTTAHDAGWDAGWLLREATRHWVEAELPIPRDSAVPGRVLP